MFWQHYTMLRNIKDSRAILDGIDGVITPDTVSNIKAGRSEVITPFVELNNTLVFNNMQEDDGWNIEIISITDLNSNTITSRC